MSRTLFALIENQGGMGDVAAAYLEAFRQKSTASEGHQLVLFSQIRSKPVSSKFGNIHVIHVPGLTFDSHLRQPQKNKIFQLIEKNQIRRVVCDYLSYQYFREVEIPVVADVHYLIAKSNRIQLGQSKGQVQKVFFQKTHLMSERQIFDFFLRREALERELLRRAESIIVNSRSTQLDVMEHYPFLFPHKKISICPVQACLPRVRSSSFDKKKPALLFHGRVNPLKGIQFLPAVAAYVASDVVVVGANAQIRENLKLDLPPRLKFHNWKSSRLLQRNYLSRFRFHLFPSLYEPWGLALTKSLQNGAICLAHSGAGGHREQIRHGENGFMVDFESPDAPFFVREILESSLSELKAVSKRARASVHASIGRPEFYVEKMLDITRWGDK